MTPYENETMFTTDASDQIVPVAFPGRGFIDRIAVTRIGTTGTVTVDAYNRAFTGPAAAINLITSDDVSVFDTSESANETHTVLHMQSPILVKVGDAIVVAGASVTGYNVIHRIVTIIRDVPANPGGSMTVVTDQDYTADSSGGTATLEIQSAEQNLYHVFDQITGATFVEATPAVPFVNLDPLPNNNTGYNRFIYLKLADKATYKVVLRGRVGISQND